MNPNCLLIRNFFDISVSKSTLYIQTVKEYIKN